MSGEHAVVAADEHERPNAPLRTETFRKQRPDIVGGDKPEQPPYPILLRGAVQHGFGRGGKELGILTANLPDEALAPMTTAVQTGIYFGYAQVHTDCPKGDTPSPLQPDDLKVWPMVMSLGWNPFYKNEKLTAEVHIMHEYTSDFYGHEMVVVVLGYIRPELDYTSREALIEDIETDKKVALKSLDRPGYQIYRTDSAFRL